MTGSPPLSPDRQVFQEHRDRVNALDAAFNRLMRCHSDMFEVYKEGWAITKGGLADRHTRLAEVRDRVLVLREMLAELRAEAFGLEEEAASAAIVVPGAEEPPTGPAAGADPAEGEPADEAAAAGPPAGEEFPPAEPEEPPPPPPEG